MTNVLGQWMLSSIALLLTSFLVPGFRIISFGHALIAAIVIGVLNLGIRPVLLFLTLPINILTLGFFTFFINAIILKMAAWMLSGFVIHSWFSALIGAIILSLVNLALYLLLG
ncbi:MAG: phage holin family protein [Bacteriovoracaceae bacterium]|nr:phage holin family protein [Bacteriovoracaceae bacterium]